MTVRMEMRPVFVAERTVPKRIEEEYGWDYELRTERRTFLTSRGAWRWVAWGYVFRSRFEAGIIDECWGQNNEHKCHLCDGTIVERVHRLADKLMARWRRRERRR